MTIFEKDGFMSSLKLYQFSLASLFFKLMIDLSMVDDSEQYRLFRFFFNSTFAGIKHSELHSCGIHGTVAATILLQMEES